MISFEIAYTNGTKTRGLAENWRRARADGVDAVTVEGPQGSTMYQGHSLYWLYPDDADWTVGAASFYPNPITEVIVSPDGSMTERTLDWAPDLRHDDVKMGWWRPGEERPGG